MMMNRRSFLQAGLGLALMGGSVSAFAMRGAKVVVMVVVMVELLPLNTYAGYR